MPATSSPLWPRVRTILAGILLTFAVVLMPLAVTVSTLGATLTDTDRFVSTFASVAEDPAVQDAVGGAMGDAVGSVIRDNDPTPALEAYVRDSGAPPAAAVGIRMLSQFAMQSIETTARDAIDGFVASDAFADIWQRSLRIVHGSMLTTLTADAPGGLLRLDPDGTLWLQLEPTGALVRAELEARSPFIAGLVPADLVSDVRLVQEPALVQARTLAQSAPFLLAVPWILILLLAVGGMLLARRRRRALTWTAAASAGALLLLAAAVSWWPLPEDGTAGELLAAIASPARAQTGSALLATAAVCAVVALGCLLLPAIVARVRFLRSSGDAT